MVLLIARCLHICTLAVIRSPVVLSFGMSLLLTGC